MPHLWATALRRRPIIQQPPACAAFYSTIPTPPYSPTPSNPYVGVGTRPFPPATAAILREPVQPRDLVIQRDRGWLYLAEERYLDILDRAFGSGNWDLRPLSAPRRTPSGRTAFRSYALYADGRFVSEAVGDAAAAAGDGAPEAVEAGCKYAALVRCCKDLGVALELWDPPAVSRLRSEFFVRVPGRGWTRKPG
ncbi:hypothetical protein HK405_013619 [Cladochytrium tenue]|nr:hypothetical protein HK405_013619 [Cladochytrium tenue]